MPPTPLEEDWHLVEADDVAPRADLHRVTSGECIRDAVVVERDDADVACAAPDSAAQDAERARVRARVEELHDVARCIVAEARADFEIKEGPRPRPRRACYEGAFVGCGRAPDALFIEQTRRHAEVLVGLMPACASFEVVFYAEPPRRVRTLLSRAVIAAEKRERYERERLERRNLKRREKWGRGAWRDWWWWPDGAPWLFELPDVPPQRARARERPARAVAPRSDRPHYARRAPAK